MRRLAATEAVRESRDGAYRSVGGDCQQATELMQVSEVTVVETLGALPLLPVCVGGGRLMEVTATEVPDDDGSGGTVSRWS